MIQTNKGTSICDNLFFAMIGNIGSGVTTTADELEAILQSVYNYRVVRIRVSDFIGSSYLAHSHDLDNMTREQKIDTYQDIGNELRKSFGNDTLARRCIHRVLVDSPQTQRVAYIFDSFKHPDEIAALRHCFEERLIAIAVFCPARVRKNRLLSIGLSSQSIDSIFDRDEFELETNGQKVRDTAYLADFFIRNADDNRVSLRATMVRYMQILFGTEIHTPHSMKRECQKPLVQRLILPACHGRWVQRSIVPSKNFWLLDAMTFLSLAEAFTVKVMVLKTINAALTGKVVNVIMMNRKV